MQEDEDLVDKRFKEVMLDGTERWIAMAEEKLADTGIRRDRCRERRHVRDRRSPRRGRVVETGDEAIRSSSATSRWSRWGGRTRRPGTRSGRRRDRRSRSGSRRRSRLRPIPDDDLQLPRAALRVEARQRAGPERRPDLRLGRAGDAAGRLDLSTTIKRFQPMLSLHGHIHESKGRRGSARRSR